MTKRIDASPSSAGFRRALDVQATRTRSEPPLWVKIVLGIPSIALLSGFLTYLAVAVWVGVVHLIY